MVCIPCTCVAISAFNQVFSERGVAPCHLQCFVHISLGVAQHGGGGMIMLNTPNTYTTPSRVYIKYTLKVVS